MDTKAKLQKKRRKKELIIFIVVEARLKTKQHFKYKLGILFVTLCFFTFHSMNIQMCECVHFSTHWRADSLLFAYFIFQQHTFIYLYINIECFRLTVRQKSFVNASLRHDVSYLHFTWNKTVDAYFICVSSKKKEA